MFHPFKKDSWNSKNYKKEKRWIPSIHTHPSIHLRSLGFQFFYSRKDGWFEIQFKDWKGVRPNPSPSRFDWWGLMGLVVSGWWKSPLFPLRRSAIKPLFWGGMLGELGWLAMILHPTFFYEEQNVPYSSNTFCWVCGWLLFKQCLKNLHEHIGSFVFIHFICFCYVFRTPVMRIALKLVVRYALSVYHPIHPLLVHVGTW